MLLGNEIKTFFSTKTRLFFLIYTGYILVTIFAHLNWIYTNILPQATIIMCELFRVLSCMFWSCSVFMQFRKSDIEQIPVFLISLFFFSISYHFHDPFISNGFIQTQTSYCHDHVWIIQSFFFSISFFFSF